VRSLIAQFEVYGEPKPQGSMRGFLTKSGKVVVTHGAGKEVKSWRNEVASAAVSDMRSRHEGYDSAPMVEGPVSVVLRFLLRRPKSAPKKRTHPITRPDLDKLVRAILDAITGPILSDDSIVVEISARKAYATGGPPRVEVEVWREC
jgi:crossover junction endodeoxyribonuclease RusA